MSESLLLVERVRNTIDLGESHFREFKSALEGPDGQKKGRSLTRICADIGEALVAFANADGGELLIGVEDDGTITGVPHDENDIRAMLAAVKTHVHPESLLPITHATRLTVDTKSILFFSVAKGSTEIYQLNDGRCMRRKDKTTVPETVKRIEFERQEVKSREYDRLFVDGATVGDLDGSQIQGLADRFLRGLSVEKYLQQIGLAEYGLNGLRLRMAALLLFARDIQRWHPRSQVRILEVAGTQLKSGEYYNIRKEKVVQGNIFDLLLKSWEELRFSLASKTEFGADARFEQKYIYPEQACREALVNAIAHRDYCTQNGIDIFIFDDRMEIRNPGSLLSTLTLEDLQELHGAHESRNAYVARVLRENKFMRELGEGMKRMFESMEENELQHPSLHSDSTSFGITLAKKSVFTEQQEQWLSIFKQFDLTPLQKRIVICGMNGREITQQDIYKAMSTNDLSVYQREVSGIRNSGILVEIRTNPQALSYSKQTGIDKALVPRFKVQIPASPRVTESNLSVFVSNLPYSISPQEVRTLFESCGRIQRIDLPEPKQGGGEYRFGFVTFYELEAAQKAIKDLDGVRVYQRIIAVRKYIPKAE
jgi:ATP-dependent DNA helicase RecG